MTPSTRKKVLIGAAGVMGVVVAALLIAPAFLDLDKYKPQIAAGVKRATGRELVISGPAALTLLPMPTVSVAGVKFFNERGAQNPTMVEVKSVTVRPSLLALLGGRIEVDEVSLVEPKIVLEVNAEGKPNWEFTPSVAEAKPAAPKPSAPVPLSLGRLTIDNGTLIFSDSKAGLSVTADKANFTASVGSLDGPYTLAGGAMVNGAPLKIDLSVGAKASDGLAISLALEAGGGNLGFKGKVSELGPQRQAERPRVGVGRLPNDLRRHAGQPGGPDGAASAASARRQVQLRRPGSRHRRRDSPPRTSSWRWPATAARARSR
jgi:uncharacterized protein involved in outer membrane biogenesis